MKNPTKPAIAGSSAFNLSEAIKEQVQDWLALKHYVSNGKVAEMELRKKLAAVFVPNPKEGTNRVEGPGFEVKVKHTLNYKLDTAALDAVMAQLDPAYRALGTLIHYEPAFDMNVYRSMPDDQKKIFQQALTITDGSPELEIVLRTEQNLQAANDLGTAMYGTPLTKPPVKPPVHNFEAGKKVILGTIGKKKHPVSGRPGNAKRTPNKKTVIKKPTAKKKRKK